MNREVLKALKSEEYVSGHTHSFYKYPARFYPGFVKAVVENYTEVGDRVIDPFMGGGTTAVEALACGRRFFGVDINPLATFLATVKTTPLAEKDFEAIERWARTVPPSVNLHKKIEPNKIWAPYGKNMPWYLRRTIAILLRRTSRLKVLRQRDFVKCGILATGQWALDCKSFIPTSRAFLENLQIKLTSMIAELQEYQEHLREILDVPLLEVDKRRRILCRPIAGIQYEKRVIMNWVPAKLVLTSPPYPGVHVVYNRWQFLGRKETPAPYWIIGSPDGQGLSHYTMGDRQQKGLKRYFRDLRASFEAIRHFLDRHSVVVQLVGFSDPSWQLEKYLDVMEDLGYKEIGTSRGKKERYSRQVPNRRWYTNIRNLPGFSDREFLLVHRLK
jgi:DNA modification methylase